MAADFFPSSCCRSVHNSGAPDDQVQVPLSAGEYCLRSHWSVNPTQCKRLSLLKAIVIDIRYFFCLDTKTVHGGTLLSMA